MLVGVSRPWTIFRQLTPSNSEQVLIIHKYIRFIFRDIEHSFQVNCCILRSLPGRAWSSSIEYCANGVKMPQTMAKHSIACGVALFRTQMQSWQLVSLQQKPDDSFIIMYSGVFFYKHLAIANSSKDSNF